jgi:hypothetical protein
LTTLDAWVAWAGPNADQECPLVLIGERGQRLYPLDPRDIDYIESEGNYVKYRCGGAEYIKREALKQLDGLLRPFGFLRIERSLLLNLRAIEYVEPVGHGIFAFMLTSGVTLQSGPAYRATILKVLPLRRRGRNRSSLKRRVNEERRLPRDMRGAGSPIAPDQGPASSRGKLRSSRFFRPKTGDC